MVSQRPEVPSVIPCLKAGSSSSISASASRTQGWELLFMRASRHGAAGGPWHRSLTIVFQRCEEDPWGHHILPLCPQRVTGGCWHLSLRVSTWTCPGQAQGSRRAWSPPCHCGTGEWGSHETWTACFSELRSPTQQEAKGPGAQDETHTLNSSEEGDLTHPPAGPQVWGLQPPRSEGRTVWQWDNGAPSDRHTQGTTAYHTKRTPWQPGEAGASASSEREGTPE